MFFLRFPAQYRILYALRITMPYLPIRDYAIIGNLRSAALVSQDGSVDWACAPFLDSPSVFAKLLDDQSGGYWRIAPEGAYTSVQRYVESSNVLETVFTTDRGECVLTDFIPIEPVRDYVPPEDDVTFKLKRNAACVKGEIRMRTVFCPRFNYARGETVLEPSDSGVTVSNGSNKGVLASTSELTITDGCAESSFLLREGDSRFFIFRFNRSRSPDRDVQEEQMPYHAAEIGKTNALWRSWLSSGDAGALSQINPKWRPLVERSLLVLKVLFFDPVGTVAAAATTSLPEAIGGGRNWDYRYTWFRDSAFVFRAFSQLGYVQEQQEYVDWFFNIFRTLNHPSELRVLYPLHGDSTESRETVLSHLNGYRGSAPVRIGNEACTQHQLDVYGVLLDMVFDLCHTYNRSFSIGEREWQVLSGIADFVTTIWRNPDAGLWEMREENRHFTFSKVMCWVALDRAISLGQMFSPGVMHTTWERERDLIRETVERDGWNEELGSFTGTLRSSDMDTGLLLLSPVGFLTGDDPRMISTVSAIRRTLECSPGLLRRYNSPDGFPSSEGAFLASSFWLTDALVLQGDVEEAEALFERVISLANHAGLFSEEINPDTGDFLGNFPQAYTHAGIINSALLLSRAKHGVS